MGINQTNTFPNDRYNCSCGLTQFQGNQLPFGGQQVGGGAPNRTESGRVAAGFRADPELRFPKHAAKTDVEPGLVSEATCNINNNTNDNDNDDDNNVDNGMLSLTVLFFTNLS